MSFSFFLSSFSILCRWMHALQWGKLWGQSFQDQVWTRVPSLELSNPTCSRIYSFQVSFTGKEIRCLQLCGSMGHVMLFGYFHIPQEANASEVLNFKVYNFPHACKWGSGLGIHSCSSKCGPRRSDTIWGFVRDAESLSPWIWICIITRFLADSYAH